MKKILGAAIAASMLAAGAANAAIVSGYGSPYNGETFLVAWDDVAKRSVIVDTGIHFNDIFNAVNVDDTEFNASLNISSALTAAFGGNLSNVQWNLATLSRQSGNDEGGWGHYGTLITTNQANAVELSQLLTFANIADNIGAWRTFINGTGDAANSSPNEAVNNYYATADDTSAIYAGTDGNWGAQARLGVPFGTTQLGSGELNMYFLGSDESGMGVDMYQAGTWALNLATGALTFSSLEDTPEVPVPAAAWLLVSGLAGLGTVARRRKQA